MRVACLLPIGNPVDHLTTHRCVFNPGQLGLQSFVVIKPLELDCEEPVLSRITLLVGSPLPILIIASLGDGVGWLQEAPDVFNSMDRREDAVVLVALAVDAGTLKHPHRGELVLAENHVVVGLVASQPVRAPPVRSAGVADAEHDAGRLAFVEHGVVEVEVQAVVPLGIEDDLLLVVLVVELAVAVGSVGCLDVVSFLPDDGAASHVPHVAVVLNATHLHIVGLVIERLRDELHHLRVKFIRDLWPRRPLISVDLNWAATIGDIEDTVSSD
ncbi:uncharacterized protein PG998_012084 [Apiospora kogelbergensis]|uniref:uncharacterized protein n=1 Tax=Apiospora kogelbergensis TaxID=1337665 RepID=UPI003130901C